jgi:hypothetical protein
MTDAETPITRWHRLHPGVLLEGWVTAMAALDDIRSDWAYRNGRLALPERYDGRHGWWL